ncbi:amidohydrolase family protein [Thermoactinomyces mirandus]|uniref:Amidohydrolase family protein n=1 Tax=Thermoactinomyces mirandus TaxID=2756294 RepID=A0A7W1XRV9_9BACL|nr:amidohydrolase family protein [Thermoactinomyces mirandus]MBA4601991.1 amidohydrolase family protein [Thermoactinomyces mirandus]
MDYKSCCEGFDVVGNKTIGFLNGKFLLGSEQKLSIFQGHCKVQNGKIKSFDQDSTGYDVVIDLKGSLVTPSLINAHVHLGETLFQGLKGRWSLEQYLMLAERWNNQLDGMKEDAWIHSAHVTVNEMIRYGTSVFCAARSGEIAQKHGLMAFSGYPLMESKKLNSFLINGFEKYAQFVENTIILGHRPGIFLHSLYSNRPSTLELARKCLSYASSFLTIHIAETIETRRKVIDKWGKPDIDILYQYGMLDDNTILVHGGYCSLEELKVISGMGSKLVLCPVSNQRLGTKCLNPNVLESEGIKWCLGTDGLATGITADLFQHMRLMKGMFSDIEEWKLWASVTYWAAQVLGIEDSNGKLDVGFNADFCVFQAETPDSVEEILHWLVFQEQKLLTLYIKGYKIKAKKTEIPCLYKPKQPLTINILTQLK